MRRPLLPPLNCYCQHFSRYDYQPVAAARLRVRSYNFNSKMSVFVFVLCLQLTSLKVRKSQTAGRNAAQAAAATASFGLPATQVAEVCPWCKDRTQCYGLGAHLKTTSKVPTQPVLGGREQASQAGKSTYSRVPETSSPTAPAQLQNGCD